MYVFSAKYKFKFYYKKPLDSDVKKTFKLIMPAIAGVGINQLNFLTGRILASFLGFGSISFLYYANRLFQFPLGVFSIAMSSVSLAELSKAYTENNIEKLEDIFNKAFLSIFIIIIPATLGLFFLSEDITSLVYERLSFGKQDTLATAFALRMYSLGLIFYSFVNLFSKAFHANKDTKTPVKMAFYSFIFNVIFALLLLKPFEHGGIALASSLAAVINSILLYKNLEIKINFVKLKTNILKILFSSLLMLVILLIMKYFNLNVLITITICGIFYFYSLKLQKLNVFKVLK
jgi:putative peptidoglycan lipid II flippase